VAGAPASGPAAPEPDALATLVDEIGWALARRRAALTRRLGRRGVTGSQTMLLFHLRMRGDLPMGRLADLLGIGLPNLTGIVDRMEEHGLVRRRRVPDDRRVVLVSLTDDGRRIPEEIEGVQRELLAATFAALDDDRLRTCLAALREATSRTDDQDIGPGCTRPDPSHSTTDGTID
jgi:DNA-binding MarR family transcriptional regulator